MQFTFSTVMVRLKVGEPRNERIGNRTTRRVLPSGGSLQSSEFASWSYPASLRRQGIPGRKRVHVVSPVRDLPVLKLDNRTEPIFVLCTCRENRPMDFVFDDDDAAIVRPVGDQLSADSNLMLPTYPRNWAIRPARPLITRGQLVRSAKFGIR